MDTKAATAKAKELWTKGASVLGELKDFSAGNIEAVMASGKIFAAGVEGLGSEYLAEGRAALSTLASDVAKFEAIKSPADLIALQSSIAERNFGMAMAFGKKSADAMVQLATEATAPLSKRVDAAFGALLKSA